VASVKNSHFAILGECLQVSSEGGRKKSGVNNRYGHPNTGEEE